jgi:hypothetical protein
VGLCNEGKERFEYVFREVIDVICLSVVGVQKNLNMFPRSLNGVGVGANLSMDEADSMIYCVVRVALVLKTKRNVKKPKLT